jgi:SOS-response transcriptional repressor LexA
MDKIEELRKILQEKTDAEEITQVAIAQKTGIDQASLSKFINKVGGLSAENFLKLSDWAGWQIDNLPGKIKRVGELSPIEEITGKDMKLVNVYQRAGAGSAYIPLDELKPYFTIAIPYMYFAEMDFAVLVDGHSMEPTIKHLSFAGAKSTFHYTANELYVAQLPDEGLVIKRVVMDSKKDTITFKSDNPNKENYPDREFNIGETENFLLGRVTWVMYRY